MILIMKMISTPAATNICAAIASLIFRGSDTDAIRSIEVNIRDMQKTILIISLLISSTVEGKPTEYEQIW